MSLFTNEELSALAAGIDSLIRSEGIAAIQNKRVEVYSSALAKLEELAQQNQGSVSADTTSAPTRRGK